MLKVKSKNGERKYEIRSKKRIEIFGKTCLAIYYIKIKAFTSGIVTIILNRLGDIGLLLIIGLITLLYRINEFIINFYY